jgi:N-acetyl-gamma-glutamyl-phosphate reductase
MAIDLDQNIRPYKIGREHQHVPEIEQEISNLLNKKIEVIFAPHVLAFKYGILSTNYVKLKEPIKWGDIDSAYKEMYSSEPFIRILNKYPEIPDVVGTNFCDICISIDKVTKMCIVMSAIDNVIKGASGQAIQNMNVMYGFEETEGLPISAVLKAKKSHSYTEEHQQKVQPNKEFIQ